MFGIINLFKPTGMTSRDCVNHIQRLVRPEKVGHAGTLDPMAEGVLLVAVGQAVRLVDWLHELKKTYIGSFQLGVTSPSDDCETEIETIDSAPTISADELHAILVEFTGRIDQVPPQYSAIQVAGKRAYDLARKGTSIQLESRPVEIHGLKVIDFDYPKFTLDVECGSGTYIRSLGRDIGLRLGSGAIMTKLIRTAIGDARIDHSVSLQKVMDRKSIESSLLNPIELLDHIPNVVLDETQLASLRLGKSIEVDGIEGVLASTQQVFAIDGKKRLRSIIRCIDHERWQPFRNFDVAND